MGVGSKLEPQWVPGWVGYTAGAQSEELTCCLPLLHPLQIKAGSQSSSFPRGTSASSGRTQLCQIHQSDRYCNGFGLRGGPGPAGGSQPPSDKTEWFWNSLGRGRERSQPHFSPASSLKMKFRIKVGKNGDTSCLVWSLVGQASPPLLHQPPCWKGSPRPCRQPPRAGEQADETPAPGARGRHGASIQPIPPLYRWEH